MSGFVSGFFGCPAFDLFFPDVPILICFFQAFRFYCSSFWTSHGCVADVPTFLDRLKKKAVSAKILFGQTDVNEFVHS